MRTFISIELTDEIKERISGAIEKLKKSGASVKWVETGNLHITLKFLGEVPEGDLENLTALTSKALRGKGSFRAAFKGLGTFPGGKSPRVVWVDTAGGREEQIAIASSIEEELGGAGFVKEERAFKPHITIGRVREPKHLNVLLENLEKFKDKPFGEMTVDHVNIMKSKLSPKGPTYEVLKSISLEQ